MVRVQRVLTRVLSGSSDQNIRFNDLRNPLLALGFDERVRGSHHIFTRDDIVEIINLQSRTDGEAKAYQVRQVRDLIVDYQLAQEIEK